MICKRCGQEMTREERTQVLYEYNDDKLHRQTTYIQDGWWCNNEDCFEEILIGDENLIKARQELKSFPWQK